MINKNRANNLYLVLFLLLFHFTKSASASITRNIDLLLETANKIRTSDPSKFERLLTELEEKSTQLTKQQSYYLNYLKAYKLTFNGKGQEALPLFQNILVASDANLSIKFRARLTIINIFAIEQNWTEGLSYLSILLEELPNIKDLETHLNGLTVTAIFYNQLGQYTLGLKYAEQLFNSDPKNRTACFAATMIIESKLHLNQLENNDIEIKKAISLCEDEAIAANFIRSYSAKFSLTNNKPEEVIKFLTPHLAQVNATQYPRLIVEIYTSLAEAYWLQGNLIKAEELALESVRIGEKIKTTQAVIKAYKLLYKVAKKRSNHQEVALQYYETYAQLDKTYINETQAKHLAFQLAEHQAFEQESQIKLLNEQNNALAAEQALAKTQANNRKLIILSLGLIIIVFAFLGMRFWRTHKRVRQLAEYDPLTGIYNRGHFTQVTNSALKYCQNAKQDLSLIMFDLDHFKKVNDIFGHACGDWALKETIKACKGIGRQNDIFARLGGEEFCLVLPSCNIDAAMLRAEACRAAIEAIITEESGHDFSITASFGVTDVKRSGFTLDKLLADADMAAYTSKNAGRNRITMFEIPQTEKPKKLDNSWDYET
ncbi:tetratricopeptide repeat-containing diguanylate cyclase [Colwellia psychrerythraea]|uniref:diguanylate cyclase n=1 Tax=Colwellia psychrerythraea TaxID=28229 RepID=A0A099KDP7_COLPS|nr:GGDEF domain-containing protein [Colwellia psychrerythraea]KGJ88450.1 diguanylate cyclase [Colwellia psychrerythraea]